MEVEIKPISYAHILQAPNAQELIDAYSVECAIPEIGASCPQTEKYELLEASGVMRTFGVYSGDDLVGFASVLVSELPHYSRKVATLESIFVHPDYRVSHAGRLLMLAVEQHADGEGCEAILYCAPTDSRFDHFLGNLEAYRHTNNVYCRRLN